MGKKLIRVKISKELLGGYAAKISAGTLYFGFVKDLGEKTKDGLELRQQTSKFTGCREFLCEAPRNAVNSVNKDLLETDIDFGKFRLLLATSCKNDEAKLSKERVFSGKRALNLFESEAGWKQSVITTVKHEQYDEDQIWMLTGDKRWMKAPQMISLAALIMRLGFRFNLKTDSLKDLMDHFSDIATQKCTVPKSGDFRYIGPVRNHIVTLMKNVDKVFHEDRGVYFPAGGEDGWNGYGGIDTLMKSSTGLSTLTDSFRKFVLDIPKKQSQIEKEKIDV